jgi:hypothetical protein
MHVAVLPRFLLLLLCLPASFLRAGAVNLPHAAKSRDLPSAPSPAAPELPSIAGRVALLQSGHVTIPRLSAEPRLADFLGNPARSPIVQRMLRVTGFIERYPHDGQPATESTAAYLGYTREYFYVAFVCKDRTPGLIRAHMLARDSLGDDDSVELMLDTFNDQRRAFTFDSNALGIQGDGLYSEQNGGDSSFDTVWDTWGKRTPNGYVVLMRIPFASLYFQKAGPGQARTWGIILERNISHANEQVFWPQIRHSVAGRLTQDVAAEGFQDIERGKNLQFEPYLLARNLRQLNSIDADNPYFESKHLQGYGGLDAKFILHNSLVLDTTVNPDFSQVGIDNPAIPNQRYPAYFAEVRPFFLENSSYFQTPISLYYSNNIVKPQYGARLTGKLGDWALGLLGVDDRSPGESVPPQVAEFGSRAEYYTGRLNRDLGKLSNVGLIYADREYIDSFNRAGGFDYRARLKNRWTLTGQAISSATRNLSDSTNGEQECENLALSCSGQSYTQSVNYNSLHRNWWFSYDDTSAGFVTDTGFFRRPDVREPSGSFSYTFRPSQGPILSHGPSLYAERIWDHQGTPLDAYINPSYSVSFKHRSTVSGYVSLGQDRLRPIDYAALPQDVEYNSRTAGFNFYTSPGSYLALGGGYRAGSEINYNPPSSQGPGPVNVSSPNLNLEVKPISSIDLQNSYVYSHFTEPGSGDVVYDNHELISRWNYQMTKALSFNLIGQYISTLPSSQYTALANSKSLFADALLTYMPHPGTAVYVGYLGNFANIDRALCTRDDAGQCDTSQPILAPTYSSMINDGKTIYVKVSYLLRF